MKKFGVPSQDTLNRLTKEARTLETFRFLLGLGGVLEEDACCYATNAEILRDMIDLGADPTTPHPFFGTALAPAIINRRVDVLIALLGMNVDTEKRSSMLGQTPLEYAFSTDEVECLQALLDAGANPDIHNCNILKALRATDPATVVHPTNVSHQRILCFKAIVECERTSAETLDDLRDLCKRVIRTAGNEYARICSEILALFRTCFGCDKPARTRCNLCRVARYCDWACQQADWSEHLKICQEKFPGYTGHVLIHSRTEDAENSG